MIDKVASSIAEALADRPRAQDHLRFPRQADSHVFDGLYRSAGPAVPELQAMLPVPLIQN
jgi:hypothetical protein